MLRITQVLTIAGIAILSGCASLPRDTGFVVTEKSAATVRQEPWQNISISRSEFSEAGVAVAYVPLCDTASQEWRKDFIDPARKYIIRTANGEMFEKPLERVVFRAPIYKGEQAVGLYDAVLNPDATGFFVLIPVSKLDEVRGDNMLIVPSHGRWVMTLRCERVPMEQGQSFSQMPSGFFERHPSTLDRAFHAASWTEAGKAFLTDMLNLFPVHFRVGLSHYLGRPDVEVVAAEFTSVLHPADKLISCTSFKVVPGMTLVSAGMYVIQAIRAIAADDCLE